MSPHSPMAAFASVAHQHRRPLQQIISTNIIHHHPSTIAKYVPTLTSAYTSAATATASSTALNINPIAIMGGAAADTLTTPAIITMFLLAIQYCAQPPITRKFLDSRANKKGITMVEEIIKMGFSAAFFISCGE